MFHLSADNLGKRFGARKVFAGVSFELTTGQSLAIIGPNGSGKSTLVMTLLGYHTPNKGSVAFSNNEHKLDDGGVRTHASLVSPYLNLYDYLTAEENLKFFSTVGGGDVTGRQINDLLNRVGLNGRGMDLVAEYSSGMKQRLKYAVALLGDPAFLFLDEPTANLDDSGKAIVADIIAEWREKAIVIVATNEKEEQAFANELCRLGE